MNVVISDHAAFQIARRGIRTALVMETAQSPQQIVESREGRAIYQSHYVDRTSGRTHLIRVVVERQADTLYVVTAYRTSKIEKYWKRG